MADAELEELKELKAKLVKKVCNLRDELKRNKRNKSQQREIHFDDLVSKSQDETKDSKESKPLDKETARLCDISQSIIGIQFKNVEKNWIRDDVYRYKAEVVSKALRFALDVTVDVRENGFTIEDINCHFVNLEKCYLQEIAPWIQRFTREKNFSYLTSGITDYSEQSIIRAKILRTLESKDYISMDKCQDEGGGIYVFVHPPAAEERVFFKFLWSTKFVDRSWRIEHMFDITPIEAGETFVKANEDLLQGFCQIGLRKPDLEDLWNRLCSAIDSN